MFPPVVPAGRPDGRGARRLAPVALGLLLVLLLALGGWLLLGPDGGEEDTAADNQQPAENRPPETQPDSEPDDSQTTDNQPKPDDATEAEGDPAAFVEDYYALMPGDTDTGWKMLGGSLKTQGKKSYEAFWSGITNVQVSNVTAESSTSVVYDITYVGPDGPSSEHKRITLEEHGGRYLIVDDEQA